MNFKLLGLENLEKRSTNLRK